MTRQEIVRRTLESSLLEKHFTKTVVKEALDFCLEEISESLTRGESVKLPGFGTFLVKKRKGRMGRNPQTGEKLMIETRQTIAFKPSRNFWKSLTED